jgi:HSP20 family molecular chaperone IbpA
MANVTTAPKGQNVQAAPEQTRGGAYFVPRVDIFETENELTLLADLPGVRSEDVDLRYENGELILHARVRPRHQDRTYLLNEYEVGDFYRAFAIHESIDSGKIAAECKNGVLVLHLPKAAQAQPRQIKVTAQ